MTIFLENHNQYVEPSNTTVTEVSVQKLESELPGFPD